MVDTGFPGKPKKQVADFSWAMNPAPHLPKTTGRPGWILAPVKKNSACNSASACSTKS